MTFLMTPALILAQRGTDNEEWVNVLFIVVMAVLWAVGALIKGFSAKGQKTQKQGRSKSEQSGGTWQQRLLRKAEEMQRAAEAKAKQATEHMRQAEEKPPPKPTRPASPPSGRVTVREGPRGESILIYEKDESQAASHRQELAARQRQAREAVSKARRRRAQRPPASTPHAPPRIPSAQEMTPLSTMPAPQMPAPLIKDRKPAARPDWADSRARDVLDYSDPDALTRAILHYEILGKPVALRDPERTTIC